MGTLKRGAASQPNVTTVWNFIRPAGQKITLKTQKDPKRAGKVEQKEMHGAGSVGPYAIAQGNGSCDWSTEVADHESRQIAAVAKNAGIPIMGDGGLLFDIVITTTVDGLPTGNDTVEGCSLGKFEPSIKSDGNMVAMGGQCAGATIDGVPLYRVAQ
jgi:hypothetical protein